ncbi:MAG: tetratricopeptide repeat protein [Oscillatoriales cyanobacterium SM2_2_1]|nr:tetratricopeptide repeat protein [Oscillatoriales cyanobacterium SM2_2_1]
MRWLISCFLLCCLWLGIVMMPAAARPSAIATSDNTEMVPADSLKKLNEFSEQAFAATEQGDYATAETYWTRIIDLFPDNAAAWSNRGNAKVSQNQLEESLIDYTKSIELAPNAPDPYVNRGAALEGLSRWQEAIADYDQALKLNPRDGGALNNRGNAKGSLGNWAGAKADFELAMQADPRQAMARANHAIALYELGETDAAIREMRGILRKYPNFVDVRAALTAVLWQENKRGEAESNWVSVENLDNRYRDLNWVKTIRRWSPKLTLALEKFLSLQ